MPTGYYLTKRQRKDSIMQTGIHSIHPSGIVLQVKPEPNSPDAETQRTSLLHAMDKIANIMAKLHTCNCADVLTEEPPKADNPLLAQPNAFFTPHIAWASTEARIRLLQVVTCNVKAFLNGKPQNSI